MNIPEEVLTRLICDNCDLYLSCGPIYFVHDSEEIYCGRCQIAENQETKEPLKKTRVKQLEAYAELFEYPCKYEENGCSEKLPFALTQHVHEQNCEFKPHVCPVAPSGSCDWIGRWDALTEHCRVNHPDKILKNHCEFQHNFRVSNLESFILTAFNVLFFLQFKICTETAKLYYSLRFLGNSENIQNYKFEIEIKRDDSKFIKKGEILTEEFLTLQERTSLQINLNSLLGMFDGYDDITFKIFIKTSILNCEYCGIVISERIQDDLICNNCVEDVRTCKFQSKGCLYKDFNFKWFKHKWFYCKYIEKCFVCVKQLKSGENLINHLVEVHEEVLQCEIGSKFRIPFSNGGWSRPKWFILSSDIGNVFCTCCCYDTSINMSIYSRLRSKELNNFECKVTIEDPTAFHKKTITVDEKYTFNSWDWFHEIVMNDFPSWQSNNVGVDVTININKI